MQTIATSESTGWLVRSKQIKVHTDDKVGLYNITDRVTQFLESSGIQNGFLVVSSMHTTTAVFINEFQDALLRDIKQVLEQLVREDTFYFHNSDDYSDCERKNATAHLRAMLLGHQVVIPILNGMPAIGTWQSIILAELDGPRTRTLHLQAMGTP